MKRPIMATLLAFGLGLTSAARADEGLGLDDLPRTSTTTAPAAPATPLASPLATVANANKSAPVIIGAVNPNQTSRAAAPVTTTTQPKKPTKGFTNTVAANRPSTVPFMGARGGVGGAAAVSGAGMTGTTLTFPDEKKGDSKSSDSSGSSSKGAGASAGSSKGEADLGTHAPVTTGGPSSVTHTPKSEPSAPIAVSPPRPLAPTAPAVSDAKRPTEGKVVLFLRTPGEDEASVEAIRTRLAREAAVVRRIAPDLAAGRSPGTIAEDNVLRDAAPPGFYLPDEIDAWLVAKDGKIYVLEVQGAIFEKVASQAIGATIAVEGDKPPHDATLEPGVGRFRVKQIVAPAAPGAEDAQG